MKYMIEILINNILGQAKYYLEAAGEFYPFGAVINKDDSLSPLGFYPGEEYPASKTLIIGLEKAIKEGLEKNEYKAAAIGIDVLINSGNEKKDAIQIHLYSEAVIELRIFYYYKKEGEYIFEAAIQE
jgi:hypothetical protein